MEKILDFVQGKITCDDFFKDLEENFEIWDFLQSLIVDEMKDNTMHKIFSEGNFNRLQANNFNIKWTIYAFGEDEYSKAVAHSLICEVVKYHFPEIQCKKPKEYSSTFVLEKLGMAYLGGNDVDDLIKEVLDDEYEGNSKERIREQKKRLKDLFHLTPRKIPSWVQYEDWPMGTKSPMAFVSQRTCGERVEYTFYDVDTKEEKIIEQFY